ncbi:MAG: biopolymer transporter ExbD [Candidatus Aminicenantes bacterium]|nr:biopolymer transporter ExbD [Candidatus Aminicenantes bacterium]
MQINNNNNRTPRLTPNLAEINVTPLVDVMLVLLIIFMITAPMMQSGINVNLPTVETKTNPNTGGLIISITKDHYIYMDDHVVNLYLLESKLKEYFHNKKKKVVFLKADKELSHGYVTNVMGILIKAGVETIGIIVEEKKEK